MSKPVTRVKAKSRPLLSVVPINKAAPDESVCHVIEQFETMAIDGRLVSIAIAGVCRDGDVTSAYVVGPDAFKAMGAVWQLLRRVSSEVEVK